MLHLFPRFQRTKENIGVIFTLDLVNDQAKAALNSYKKVQRYTKGIKKTPTH